MATARVIPPKEDFDPALLITISSTGVAPAQAAMIIQNGQPVTFTNVSPSQATITFVPDSVNVGQWLFNSGNPVTLAAATNPPNPNSSKTLYPNSSYPNRTVNYNVAIAGNPNPFGPYAIQVGPSPNPITTPCPLFIAVSNSAAVPQTAMIPVGGWIQMVAMDGNNYNITNWLPSDPFSPAITQANSGISNNTPGQEGPLATVDYGFSISLGPGIIAAGGGGTIKVKGT